MADENEDLESLDERTKRTKKKKTYIAEVVRGNEKRILLPKDMPVKEAIGVLERRMIYEEETVAIRREFNDVFPYDAAYALSVAMTNLYGWAMGEKIRSFFGDRPPELLSIHTSYHETTQVPWGRFSLPNVDGFIQTQLHQKNGENDKFTFFVVAQVKRKHDADIQRLFTEMEKVLREQSLYKGQAFRVNFHDSEGSLIQLVEPKFMELSTDVDDLIFSNTVMTAINTNLFTPIRKIKECRQMGIPVKRGVLLAGNFGTGKTLAAFALAKLARDNGVTFIYCGNVDDLPLVIQFGQLYSPAVVFCEDIDAVTKGERDTDMNTLLNLVDGIESKTSEVIVVFTTNEVEKIHEALLRPGRMDAVIEVKEPDAEATERLMRLYGRNQIVPGADLSKAAEIMAGSIPAIIRESVERAQLSALSLAPEGTPTAQILITPEAMLDAAETMKMQRDLLERQRQVKPHELQIVGDAIGSQIRRGMENAVKIAGQAGTENLSNHNEHVLATHGG